LIAGVVAVLVLCAGIARASTDPYRDQVETIPCPAGPPGWTNPPESQGGRNILTPLTSVAQTDDPTYLFAAPVVQLDCIYRTSAGRDLQLSVRYALPIDLNPYNDFYVGCTITGHPQSVATAPHAWDTRDRIYRVVGAKTWSLATFIDNLDQLKKEEVPRFEAMTRDMLRGAQPFAHNCKLQGNGAPVDLTSLWHLVFKAKTTSGGVTSSAGTSGSFSTTLSPSSGSGGAISGLRVTDFSLKLTGKGKATWLRLHVGTPIDFRHGHGATLRANIVVTGSTDSSCAKGSKGTLLLSVATLTASRVAVQVCGQTYLDGKGQVTAQMETV
jgi:hypothetical protein